MEEDLRYLLALSMIRAVGSITARKLIAYTGSAEAVFREKRENLRKIPGIGQLLAGRTANPELLHRADSEIEYCLKRNIKLLSFHNKDFPFRLKHCEDAPLIIFYKGLNVFNADKIISIVGTRNATNYGKDRVYSIVKNLSANFPELIIVSGLAYGIDYHSHVAALKYGLKTIAVLGHGLHTIYPSQHQNLAVRIIENGNLCTDFASDMDPERNNFIKRNRIIAGLCDACIVAESGNSGGALITADIAASYNHDVFAIPGRVGDERSEGCNNLIKTNKAALVENERDIEYFLGWESGKKDPGPRQKLLFAEFSEEEEKVIQILKEKIKISLDDLSYQLKWPVGKVSSIIINLEFEGVVRVLPGNFYILC